MAALLSGRFNPGETVIVEPSPGRRPSLGTRMADTVGLRQTLFDVVVDAHGDGHLVLALPFHPEISVLVDDGPATLERANHAFSSVSVPAGRHRVRVVYAPGSVFWGALLSLVSLAAWLIVAMAGARRNQRARNNGGTGKAGPLPPDVSPSRRQGSPGGA